MRRGLLCGVMAVALLLPQRLRAQTVDGYRFTMTGTQTGALPGQPEGPRSLEMRGQVADGALRMDYVAGAGPLSRPGVYMLFDTKAAKAWIVDSTARQQVSLMDIMSSSMSNMPDMMASMTLSDTSSKLEDLGPGETLVGYPTRKYRLTVRYSMGVPEMEGAKTNMVQITTLHVSEKVAALDPGFASATSLALNPTGAAAKRSPLEQAIWALSSNFPKGFALVTEQDIRVTAGTMEIATASTMRVTELASAKVSTSAISAPTGLTPMDYMAYMMQAMARMQAKP